MLTDISEWIVEVAPTVGLAIFALACLMALAIVCAVLWRVFLLVIS